MDFGETFENSAFRETLEETSLKLNKEKLKLISLTNDRVPDAHFVTIGFLTEEFEGEPQVMEPDEITEWKWFSLEDLPNNMFFPSKKIIKNYLDNEFYKH